jgi:hypothetical protein
VGQYNGDVSLSGVKNNLFNKRLFCIAFFVFGRSYETFISCISVTTQKNFIETDWHEVPCHYK